MSFGLQNEELGPSVEFIGQISQKSRINENEEFKYQEKCTIENNEENKEQNVRIRDIRVMLANDYVEAEEEACLNTGLKFPAVGNSVSLDNATLADSNESSVNCDIFSFNSNKADDIVPTDVKFEMDDKCSIDDDNFELRILNDDENEIPEIKFDSRSDQNTIGDEFSLQEFGKQSSKQVPNQSYLSTDLKNAALSDTDNNNGDGKVESSTIDSATVRMSNAIDDCTSQSREAIYDCVWCMKQFPTKRSLRYHILSHLRALKQDGKDGYLTSTSEVDNAALDDTNANVSFDFACVFCDKSFSSKKKVIIHYITVHHQSDSQSQSRSKRTALNGPYWQSFENRIPEASTTASVISSSTKESSIMLNNDENGFNEDVSKQYKCYICDKQFARNSSLIWHIQFHETRKYPKPEKNTSESNLPSSVVIDMDNAMDNDISSPCTSDKHTCNICDCHFTHRKNYLQHMNLAHQISNELVSSRHQPTSDHKCESCGKFFSTSSNMRKHVRKHCKGPSSMPESEDDDEDVSENPLKEFPCNICDRSFCSKRAVNIHRSSKHRDELSDAAANDTGIIPCDSYTENEDGSFQCTVCDKIFETRKGVIRHIGYHRSAINESINNSDNTDEEENIPCPQCGKTFGSIRGMRIHANKHTKKTEGDQLDEDDSGQENESSFECHICNRTCEGLRSYKIHLSWHSRREEIVGIAKKKTDRSETGNIPQKKSDKSEAVTYPKKKSDKCETIVIPQKKLGKGICSTSASAKIHQCQYCPRWYTTQQALAGHMNTHQSFKMGAPQGSYQPQLQISEKRINTLYTCQVCGQNLSSSLNFSKHMQLHTTGTIPATSARQSLTLEDTMECDICSKFFMHKQDMAKHMRDHINGTITKENVDLSLFRCIHCPKSFVGRKSLNTHQRLHEDAQVALKRTASEHLTNALPAKQRRLSDPPAASQDNSVGCDNMMQGHQCKECDRRLSTKQSFRRHMEWHARMRKAHGRLTFSTNEAMVPIVASSTQQKEHCYFQEEVHDEGPQTVVVNDLEALGEHAVVQCVEGGNEEYFVFEQREGEAFQCSECDETHFDKLQMIVHMAHHVGKRWANGRQKSLIIKIDPIMLAPFECMFCDERFVNKVFRSNHMVKRHGNDVMQCDSCRKLFLSKKRLTAHCQQHFSDPVYRCNRCFKCFTSQWFLKRHTRKICISESSQEIKEVMLTKTTSSHYHSLCHQYKYRRSIHVNFSDSSVKSGQLFWNNCSPSCYNTNSKITTSNPLKTRMRRPVIDFVL